MSSVIIQGMLRWPKKAWELTVGLSAIIFWLTAFYHLTLRQIYFGYPKQENLANGQITPYKIKDITVYITPWQHTQLHWLLIIEIITGGIVSMSVILNKISRR